MGILLNPDNIDFKKALNSEIYIDKTELMLYTNKVINTEQQYICVSRPRRFGKSMAANMLTAYYSRGCDSKEMFSKYKIAKADSFEKHLNKYNVIHINMVDFLSEASSIEEMIAEIQKAILFELTDEFSDVRFYDDTKLARSLKDIFAKHGVPFIFVIDEWDCIFREHTNDTDAQTKYLELCERYNMPFDETKRWYDGYNLKGMSIYNPRSVVMSMTGHDYDSYWTSTETYEALKIYIEMNFEGLKDKIKELIAGEKIEINPAKFQNDMTTFYSADDILTLLVHLGYLTFDFYTKKAWIPNSEVAQEFINSIEDGGWEEVMRSIRASDELLKATLACDEEKVAELIEQSHQDNTSILKYNDENSLSCVLSLAYYSARKSYIIERELSAGKGFADLVFKPRSNNSNPAMIVELKYDNSAESAIEQIKEKQYMDCLQDYSGDVLLVGINYDKESKKHSCKIEKAKK